MFTREMYQVCLSGINQINQLPRFFLHRCSYLLPPPYLAVSSNATTLVVYLPLVPDILDRNNDDHNHESDFISNGPAMVPFDFHLESSI